MHPLRDNSVVRDFVETARAYIAHIDALPKEDFSRTTAELLARLYDLGMRLPDVEPGDVDSPDVRHKISKEINGALGQDNGYWCIFDPSDPDSEVAGAISLDLESVYDDVAGPLVLFDRGDDDALLTAVWEWRFNMESHTGRHIIGALMPLHEMATRTKA